MDAMDCLFTRRSIRAFGPDPVPDDAIQAALRAAMHAPSANNEQPWHFLRITTGEDLDFTARAHPYAAMCRQAAGAVLVCADPALFRSGDMWIQDCAAATENLLLALHAQGLGGVWVGVFPRPERMAPLADHFGLPPQIIPFALVPFGRPAGSAPMPPRELQGRIHRDRW